MQHFLHLFTSTKLWTESHCRGGNLKFWWSHKKEIMTVDRGSSTFCISLTGVHISTNGSDWLEEGKVKSFICEGHHILENRLGFSFVWENVAFHIISVSKTLVLWKESSKLCSVANYLVEDILLKLLFVNSIGLCPSFKKVKTTQFWLLLVHHCARSEKEKNWNFFRPEKYSKIGKTDRRFVYLELPPGVRRRPD